MDRFFDPAAREAGRAAAFEAFPEARGHTLILFAPTFRGNGAKSATYPIELLDYAKLHALCVEKDAVCIIRLHPFVREPLDIPEAFRDRIVDGSSQAVDVNDLLFAVDLLVTDYSSIVYEFSTQDRPMLFFAYDLEEYVAEPRLLRGLPLVRPGPHRPDVRRDARRHPARRLRTREARGFPGSPPRSLRRSRDRPRHRPDPRDVRRSRGVVRALLIEIRIWAVRVGFALARPLPLRRRVVLATAHDPALAETWRSSATNSRAGIRPSRSWSSPTCRLPACAERRGARAGPGRRVPPRDRPAVHRRRLLLPDLRGPTASRHHDRPDVARVRGVQAVRLQRAGQVVRGGRDPDRPRRHPQQLRRVPGVVGLGGAHYAEAFRLPLERFVSRLGIPRTDVLFGDDRIAPSSPTCVRVRDPGRVG